MKIVKLGADSGLDQVGREAESPGPAWMAARSA